jgi:hypothetical protein
MLLQYGSSMAEQEKLKPDIIVQGISPMDKYELGDIVGGIFIEKGTVVDVNERTVTACFSRGKHFCPNCILFSDCKFPFGKSK